MTALKGWSYLSEQVCFTEVQQVCNYVLYIGLCMSHLWVWGPTVIIDL